ncbi:hypothetical protein VIGAN_07099700 [Vigna angularis var. angularis]|uniref:RING-type domain-containing protein n=1 Tax=Vigna angularis var. angularis TaxID=157739 RepID=A0A0S3SHH0_PHAAN|nr:hypothetical protein VIGAN_07099700 [Vigna angularis var. angularis]
MPAQKRSLPDSLDEGDTSHHNLFHSRHAKQQQQQHQDQSHEHDADHHHEEEEQEEEEEGEGEGEEDDDEEEEEDEEVEEAAHDNDGKETPQDSDETPSSGSEEKPEFVYVELLEIRKDVQCPICLGIIKKTRTVMECLHRFCRECIDKSMRLGNNECPACRTHCASRRSLRDDPNYDALIAALYPDIEKYEEEELEFREEEKNRNKQIQASIAKVVQRQSEALVKRRKDTPGVFLTRSQRNQRNIHSRRQSQTIEGSEDNEEDNDNNEKDSSSADERSTEHRQKRRKRWARVRPSQPSSSMASADGGNDSDMDISRENRGISRQVSKHRKLTWGRGGFRSHTRHGSGGGSNSKSSRSSRLSKFVDHLRSLDENTNEFDVRLMLVSLDHQNTPSLPQPYLCCRPTLSVEHLYEYVARQTPFPVEGIEILAVKGCHSTNRDKSADENSALIYDELSTLVIEPHKDELEILQEHETLAGLRSKCISKMGHLVSVKVVFSPNITLGNNLISHIFLLFQILAYRRKEVS